MATKTIRSRFAHEVGGQVEGCTILERRVVIPPNPAERRLGVYDYLVEVAPAPVKSPVFRRGSSAPAPDSFTRSTPERMNAVIRRIPSR